MPMLMLQYCAFQRASWRHPRQVEMRAACEHHGQAGQFGAGCALMLCCLPRCGVELACVQAAKVVKQIHGHCAACSCHLHPALRLAELAAHGAEESALLLCSNTTRSGVSLPCQSVQQCAGHPIRLTKSWRRQFVLCWPLE